MSADRSLAIERACAHLRSILDDLHAAGVDAKATLIIGHAAPLIVVESSDRHAVYEERRAA